MEYYFYTVENSLCSFDCIKDYITQYYTVKKFPVVEISFNDNNYKDFFKALNNEIHTEEITALGSDGYLYCVSFNSCNRLQKAKFSKRKNNEKSSFICKKAQKRY